MVRGEGVGIFFNAFQRGFFLSGMGKKHWLILSGEGGWTKALQNMLK
jgi:hypothetical protein